MIKNLMIKYPLDELKKSIQLEKDNWLYYDGGTNCYAYALGLDIWETDICRWAYTPGTISMMINPLVFRYYMSSDRIIQNFKLDCDTLGINIRDIDSEDNISKDEWKVALFFKFYNVNKKKCTDFHFMRQRQDGLWYHKSGFYLRPDNLDSKKQIIKSPKECYIKKYEYQKCFALKLG